MSQEAQNQQNSFHNNLVLPGEGTPSGWKSKAVLHNVVQLMASTIRLQIRFRIELNIGLNKN